MNEVRRPKSDVRWQGALHASSDPHPPLGAFAPDAYVAPVMRTARLPSRGDDLRWTDGAVHDYVLLQTRESSHSDEESPTTTSRPACRRRGNQGTPKTVGI